MPGLVGVDDRVNPARRPCPAGHIALV